MLQEILAQMTDSISGYLPTVAGAVAILILGWLVALVISAILRVLVKRTALSRALARWIWGEKGGKEKGKIIDVERWVGRGVFYLIMLFVLIAFFQTLGLVLITEPINQLLIQVFQYLPRLFAGALLLLVAWIIASVLRWIIFRALTAVKLDERLGSSAAFEKKRRIALSKSISDAVYWLVFLFFLPAVLSALQMEGILDPVQGMINNILAFLPNIFVAAFIVVIGWFLARIVQQIVANLLVVAGVDRLSERIGLTPVIGEKRLSGVVGVIVYILILIPVFIAALNAVQLEYITQPASNMLNIMLAALPAIFAAALLVAIAYIVSRVVARVITNVLTGIGFNLLFVKLGLSKESAKGKWTPSSIAGYIALVAIILFATVEALRLLEFTALADLVTRFLVFSGHVILGLIIFGIGLFLANVAARAVQSAGTEKAALLSVVARLSFIVLAAAMALREMELANEIITLAFGLALGSVAVAAAIAFGIGGRDLAAQQLRKWTKTLEPRTARRSTVSRASRASRVSKAARRSKASKRSKKSKG
jgi:hypothetical protein